MRLWSLHPSLLDRQGLTALWREALLAQAVLAGRTKGYRHHPQLQRFQATTDPLGAVVHYLDQVQAEATRRGYRYDPARIDDVPRHHARLEVTEGQLEYELAHLREKLARRSPHLLPRTPAERPPVHPSFHVVPGGLADWERPEPPSVTTAQEPR